MSKIYERCIHNSLSSYAVTTLIKFHISLQKILYSKSCLIKTYRKLEKIPRQWKFVGTVLLDLSRAFDCIPHEGIKVFLQPVKSFRLGLNSVYFEGSILWNNLPSSIIKSQIINEFKAKLKNLENNHCICGACCWAVCIIFNF